MGLDDLPLAVEGDVSLLPVVAELGHLSQHAGGVEAHPVLILGSEMVFTCT